MRRCVLGVQRCRLAQLVFGRGLVRRVRRHQQRRRGMEAGPVGPELQRPLDQLECIRVVAPALRHAGQQCVCVRVVRVDRQHRVGLRLRAVGGASIQQQVPQIDARLHVPRTHLHRLHQLRVGQHRSVHLQIRLGHLVVRVAEVLVHLQRIEELHGSLFVLAGGLIPLAALQVLLLAHVRVAAASGGEDQRQRYHHRRGPGNLHLA